MDYAAALALARETALAAGAKLREEFHRPGGPRGARAHADIDDEVEAEVLRPRLLGALPGWGYRGEETRPHVPAADPDRHVWLVDPNDGTASYLRGHRGPAVSIGLVRDGLPVLGVVYAYCAPDDDGDLITWAEGQPLLRNGQPVSPHLAEDRPLDASDVVLLSQGANGRPAHNAACVRPARFLGVPSLAYRMALVAAGEGRLGVSVGSGPQDWDYGAGHALLRAAGGGMVDGTWEEVPYAALDGESFARRGFVFGGSAAVLRSVRNRPWETVIGPRETVDAYPLVRPVSGERAWGGLLSRAQGALMGQLVGDALGSQVEFQLPGDLAQRFPGGLREIRDGGIWNTLAGQPTDDSEMALLLARAILGNNGRYEPEAAARAYMYWLRSQPFDIGGTTMAALEGMELADRPGGDVLAGGRETANADSQANGSLMRISPLAIWGHALAPERLAELARAESALTHPNPVCQDACVVFTVAVAQAIANGGSGRDIYSFALGWARASGLEESVVGALAAAAEDAGKQPEMHGAKQGWVLLALRNAFHQVLHAPSFEEGLVRTVMLGGDTDTNAAIAGALLGAVHGYRAVPAAWSRAVLTCRPVAGTSQPRPEGCWPVDALVLAERLAANGAAAA